MFTEAVSRKLKEAMMKLLPLVLLVFATGCQTPVAVQVAAAAFPRDAAGEALVYVNNDAALNSTDKASRVSQAMSLQNDTAVQNKIDGRTVTNDWKAVEPWYFVYVDADLHLDADSKTLRHTNAVNFDKVLTDNAARPFFGGP